MANSKTCPDDAITVSTYEELQQFIHAFSQGHLNLLIVLGGPGLAKSRTVREAVGDAACWIEGNATAFGIYTKLYHHRNQLVVIDDVDNLYSDRSAVRLLKCLCQTEEEKSIGWQSGALALEREGVPREFTTTSRLVMIANEWKNLNQNVAAVQDRGHLLHFAPSAAEVHVQVGQWFCDTEIYDWFGSHLHLIREPSMRHYVRAAELKQAGMNWLRVLVSQSLPEKTLMVAELRSDPAYQSEEERAQAFVQMGGGCRATYFNHAKKLRGKKGSSRSGLSSTSSEARVLKFAGSTDRNQARRKTG